MIQGLISRFVSMGALAALVVGAVPVRAGSRLLPMMFERNQGQAAPEVRYFTRTAGRAVLLEDRRITVAGPSSRVALVFEGTSRKARLGGELELETKRNYLPSADPKSWVTGVRNFGAVRYRGLYPGIDLLVHAAGSEMEYDLVVHPGADLSRVAFHFEGAGRPALAADGGIEVATTDGAIRQHLPRAFQDLSPARRQAVDVRYVQRRDGSFRYRAARYDRRHELVIDPVVGFATLIGSVPPHGSTAMSLEPGTWTYVNALTREYSAFAVDGQGNSYIGDTVAVGARLPLDPQLIGSDGNGTVCKVNPTGTVIPYCTSGFNDVFALAVDSAGNIFVGGSGFVAKMAPSGAALLWKHDTGNLQPVTALAVDSTGGVVAVEGNMSNRVFRVTPDGAGETYSTVVGTEGSDAALGLALDAQDSVYITGAAATTTFPVTAGSGPSGSNGAHVYVVKLNAQGQRIYSYVVAQSAATLPMFGTPYSEGMAIAVDQAGAAYVAGRTSAADLPVTASAPQSASAGALMDGFVFKLNPAGTAIDYLTYLGSQGMDEALGITVDATGHAYVTGRSQCQGFPTNDTTGSPAMPLGSTTAFLVKQSNGEYRRSADGWAERAVSVAINPVNPQVIYAASGFSGKILKSTNGGANWTPLAAPATIALDKIVLDPVDPDIVWAAATGKFWRSPDAGATWTAVTLPIENLQGMKADPQSQTIRYAFGYAYSRPTVIRSTDSGASWQSLGALAPGYSCSWPYCSVGDLWIDPANPASLTAASDSGVYRSTNSGQSWTRLSDIGNVQMVDVHFDPTNPQVIWGAGYGGIRKSEDGGATWSLVLPDFTAPALAVLPHPLGGSVYAVLGGRYENVYESRNGGSTWLNLYIPVPIYSGAADPSTPAKYLLGGASPFHAFLTKLAPQGDGTVYSGCFGGSNDELGSGIVLDSAGRVRVGGVTASNEFPVSGSAAQSLYVGRNAWFVASFTEGPPSDISVQVAPATATLALGESRQFTATVTGATGGVVWSVQPATAGTISASGLYTAPASAGSNPVTIYATSVDDPSRSGSAVITLPNPVPTLFALGNYNVLAGSGAFSLYVTGTNFVPGTVVRWNGADRPTTYTSPNYVHVEFTAQDAATPSVNLVTVYNPPPGGGTSGANFFNVNNRAAVLTGIAPSTAEAWTPGFTLTVTGSDFLSGATVQWNGLGLATTFVSANTLTALVPDIALLGASVNTVTVRNPLPTAAVSAALPFTVTDTLPRTISVTPAAGTGAAARFEASYTLTAGASALSWVQLLFATAPDGGGQPYCFLHYDVAGNAFWVYGDGGFFEGPVTPGTASLAVQNSFCAMNTKTSTVTASGSTLALKADVVFKATASRNVYLRAASRMGGDTGWVQRGTWTGLRTLFGAQQVTPASGSARQQTFHLTYDDPAGFQDVNGGWVQFLVATAPDGGGRPFCFLHYDRGGNGLWMYSSDAGFFVGPAVPGTASNALDSSACSINPAGVTVAQQNGSLALDVPIALKAPMVGSLNLYQRTLDVLLRDSGWAQKGTWTVP